MSSYPKRSRSHILEDISETYLKTQLPEEWVLNQIPKDYGIDYSCEICTDNQITGVSFSIQLKAKEKENNADFVVLKNIKKSSIRLWLNKLEPVAIIVYIHHEKEAYLTWVEGNTFDLSKDQKTFQVKINKNQKLSNINWTAILDKLEEVFSRRHHLYSLPKKSSKKDENIAWDLFLNNQFSKALPELRSIVQDQSKNSLLWNAIAVCEYQLYNYEKALIAINKALGLEHKKDFRYLKASILTELGQKQSDTKILELALDEYQVLMSPDSSSSLLYNYANCLKALKLFEKAKDFYHYSLSLNPNNAECWKNLGSTYRELRAHDLEFQCYDNALSINPNLYEAISSKGITLFKFFGQAEVGLELMLKAEKLDVEKNFENHFIYLYFWIAETYLHLGNIDKAIEWHEKGINISPLDDYFLSQKSRIQGKVS